MRSIKSSSCTTLKPNSVANQQQTTATKTRIREQLRSQSILASTIKNSYYTDKNEIADSVKRKLNFGNKKFQNRPISRSLMKKYECEAVEKAKDKFKNVVRNPQKLYDSPMKLQATSLQKQEKTKAIKVHQNALQKLIQNKLATSKYNIWSSPFLHSNSSQSRKFNSAELRRIILKQRQGNQAPSLSINYLIHQFNKLFKQQKQSNICAGGLSNQVFLKSTYYVKNIRQGNYLSSRIISGIRQNGPLDARAYILFYSLFVGRTATKEEKVSFMSYFFVADGVQSIDYEQFSLIIELLCEDSILEQSEVSDSKGEQNKEEPIYQTLIQIILKDEKQDKIQRSKLRVFFSGSEQILQLLLQLIKH